MTRPDPDGERYDFAFDDRYRRPLALFGITPRTAHLTITKDGLRVRFGPWEVTTNLANVVAAEVSGPYSALKAIGVRVSMSDRGLTFGSSTERGLCLRFHRPVSGADPIGLVRHPGLTMTLAAPDEAARALTNRP